MKKFITLFILMIAFTTNAVAQWDQNPVIEETHWFGQYEYVDITPGFVQRNINWSGNYLESTEIWRSSTGGGDLAHQPKTSYYSWLKHELRFSVDNTGAWAIRGTTNSAYNPKGFNPDYGGGQGLKNVSGNTQNFYIHNLEDGDRYDVRYYVDGGSSEEHISGSVIGTATVSIPANALIRNVVITLAEYVTSDFKVEEVDEEDVAPITSSYANYRGMSISEFGTLGYKYSFEGPGVLEDKRGAAPYITMRFGNDNDMTFVRALNDVNYSYGSYKSVTPKLFTKENGATVAVESTPDDNGESVLRNLANPGADWDTQFWIGTTEYSLPAGQKFKLKFEYKADADATVHTQTHGGNAGPYIIWHCIGDLTFSTDWQIFEQEITIDNDMAGWMSVAFNLNYLTSATNYYFRNITLQIPERTESFGEEKFAAASIINAHNDLDPSDTHLQYPWTYKNNNTYSDPFNETEIKDRFVGKEWSTFTAEEDPNHNINPNNGSQYIGSEEYVYGDRFNSIWPLCGNYFYFFPEVDGLLEIEYYCEGANESAAFWYKQKEDGSFAGYGDQPATQFINTNAQDNWNTNGNNNYKLRVNVEKGGIYYLCSLPTNLHQQPIVRLKSYTFIPKFRVYPLYKVVKNTEVNTNATLKVAEITGGPYTDLDGTNHGYNTNAYDLANNTFIRNEMEEPRIKCLGNVVSAKAKIEYEGNKQWLGFYDIKFREGTNAAGEAYNPGGAVVAHVNNGVGQASFVLTIAYDAANAKWGKNNAGEDARIAATSGGKEVKHWDFYSGKGDYNASGVISDSWDLGQYKDNNGKQYAEDANAWKSSSKLFRETNKADGLTADWEEDYVDLKNTKEPIFKSIYDMEGDNADMVHETAGLVFFTHPNELGIYNENDAPTSAFQDRFIGLMGGGKLIIPRLKQNDRVVIKMGCFGNVDGVGDSEMEQKAVLWLTNAKDAKGNAIPVETDYIIGGSIPYGEETSPANTLPHGEYHFVVANTSTSDDTDFAIEVKDAALLKIYSIDIYRNAANNNADILTENSITTANGPELLFTDEDAEGTTKDMEFYLRYSGFEEPTKFGTLNPNYTRGNLGEISTTSGTKANSLKATFTKGDFGSFRSDAEVKTKDDNNTYITDYTPGSLAVGNLDKMEYPYTWDFMDLLEIKNPGDMPDDKYIDHAIQFERESSNLVDDYKGWVDDEGVHCLRNAPMNEPGILFANGGQLYAKNEEFAEIAGIGFKRSVDAPEDAKLMNRSVGIHSGSLELNADEGMFHKLVLPKVDKDAVIYVRATPIKNASVVTKCSTDGETGKNFDKTIEIPMGDNKKDYVYIMKNDADQDVELWLNGLSVQKIAVSEDFKKIGTTGYATESRTRVIDHTLTEFFTGVPIKAYWGELSDDKTKVTLKDVEFLKAATAEGDATGCVLHNETENDDDNNDKSVNIIDGGFHLFVPDMHDKGTTNINGNVMLAHLNVSNIESDDDFTRYVLSAKYYDGSQVGVSEKAYINGKTVAFYKVDPKTGAKLAANSAYLQLSSSDAQPALMFRFFEDMFGEIPTTIKTVKSADEENAVWYNLNGQAINAPQKAGIYIRNGKKVIVK